MKQLKISTFRLVRIYFFLSTLLLTSNKLFCQRIYSVNFVELPQDSQLFPRQGDGFAVIPISGTIDVPNWSYMSVRITKEGQPYSYHRGAISYPSGGDKGVFSVSNVKIKSEMSEYECVIYACTATDSILMVKKEHLVAGDFYVINGQSNAAAYNIGNEPYYFYNKYIRTFGLSTSGGPNVVASDTLWTQYASPIGAWGQMLQKIIIENKGIPTCFINGAFPGTSIAQHFRDNQNPTNLGTIYGMLLYRIKKAKATNNIKTFFWFQGENDIFDNTTTYPQDFSRLYQAWQTDYPQTEKFMVFQCNIFSNSTSGGAVVRDFQRRASSLFPKVESMAVNGIETLDGVHHSNQGFSQLANKIYRILSVNFYGEVDNINYHSPNIKKCYFTNSNHNMVTLEFDNGMEMQPVADTLVQNPYTTSLTSLSLKKYFYFDNDYNKTVTINNISYEGNKVHLSLANAINYTKIGYLYQINSSEVSKFYGPCLKNKNGMNAFSFHDISIEEGSSTSGNGLAKMYVQANASYYHTIDLSWNWVSLAKQYVIERKNNDQTFSVVATLNASVLSWTNTQLEAGTTYYYRVKAIDSEGTLVSDNPIVTVTTPVRLGTPSMMSNSSGLNQVTTVWTSVIGATSYRLERKVADADYQLIREYTGSETSYVDNNISFSTNYTYRITAFSKTSESFPVTSSLTSPKLLDKPSLKIVVLTKNTVAISWNNIMDATRYILERKQGTSGYTTVADFNTNQFNYQDSNLNINTSYTYRIKAYGAYSESLYDSSTVKTPDYLTLPSLTLKVINKNTVSLNWKKATNAIKYIIERKTETGTYQNIAQLDSSVFTLTDVSLRENTRYTYRIKAYGTYSESLYDSSTIKTPDYLTLPSLTLKVINKNTVSLNWKKATSAIKYVIERKTETGTYQNIAQLDSSVFTLIDVSLRENTRYTYRIKAYGAYSESLYDSSTVKTPDYLQMPALTIEEKVEKRQLTLAWKPIPDAITYLIKRQRIGIDLDYIQVDSTSELSRIEIGIADGTQYKYKVKAIGKISESLWSEIAISTTKILAVEKEPDSDFMTFYPNPSYGDLTIKLKQNTQGTLSIIDLRGNCVLTKSLENTSDSYISLSGYSSGIYFVHVQTNHGTYNGKIQLY